MVSVIPCLDIKDGRVVKGVHFVDLKDALDPVEAAKAYSDGGADEIAFLDITATVEKRRTVFDIVERVAKVVRAPLTVGGGIKAVSDIEEALNRGVSRVSISSAAFRDPDMVKEAVYPTALRCLVMVGMFSRLSARSMPIGLPSNTVTRHRRHTRATSMTLLPSWQ